MRKSKKASCLGRHEPQQALVFPLLDLPRDIIILVIDRLYLTDGVLRLAESSTALHSLLTEKAPKMALVAFARLGEGLRGWDWSWSYFLPLFRATNKNQYAAYAVQQAATVHMMCSDVRKVWNEHRTASMTGRPGRNVAWDYVLEKMNLNFKQYLHDHITEERLHDFGIMINALKHIRKQFEQAWRHGAGDPDDQEDHGEYSHVKDADVKVIVDALKKHLGGNVHEANGKAAAFARAHGPTTHYRYSALVPTPVGLHPMPAMVYADDGMVVTGEEVR